EKYPMASSIAQEDIYMDDVVSGGPNVPSAIEAVQQLIKMFQAGGFPLRKIMSSSKEVMESVPKELRGIASENLFDIDENFKMLGISWDYVGDFFFFKIPDIPARTVVTKRTLSSDIARIFDPLGWLGPFIIVAKLILQKLWSLKLSWDKEVPS